MGITMNKVVVYIKNSLLLVFLILSIGFISIFDSLQGLDKALQDYLFTLNSPVRSENIYVIGIDSTSLEEIGPWGTWSRGVMGEVINTLTADPDNAPAVIGIDIMYFGNNQDDLEGDAYLAEAAKNAGNVVVANEAISGKIIDEEELAKNDGEGSFDLSKIDNINQPYEELRNSTRQGFINTITDISDNKVRKSLHKLTYDGKEYFSFAYEVYKLYAEKKGLPSEVKPSLNSLNQWDIDFAVGDYGGYSLSKVLSGEIPASEFKDGIVLIGPYSTGMQDGYYTPIDSNKLFGVDIHANIVQCLIDARFKHEAAREAQTIILIATMLLLYICFKKMNIKLSTALFFVVIAAMTVIPYLLYKAGIIISIFYPLLSVILLYAGCLISNYILEIIRRKKITDNFKKYVAPQVVESLVKGNVQELKLGGTKREIAALFVDIRGFTTMSEKLNPEQVVEILNDYLNLTATSIFKYGGTLDKFIGDATMAIYNAPIDLEDYVYKSVCTALEMKKGADQLKEKMLAKFGATVSFGIGINCGAAVVGNIGASFRMEYTAIGDTVNTAARLESNAKAGQILISQSVYEAVRHKVIVTPIGEIPLKGKSKGVFIYQLDGLNENVKD